MSLSRKKAMINSQSIRHSCMVSFACVILTLNIASGAVVCPGTYDGHLQGIATDKRMAIYWSFTTTLVKTDADGKLLKKTSVPDHHGDLTVHDKKLYVAVNLGKFNEEAGQANSWVYIYDTEDLNFVSKHSIPEVVHGAGGMDYYKERFFIVGGLPEGHSANYIYEYDKDFKFLMKHTIKSGYTLMGIQTACYSQDYWWLGCYGSPPTLLKTDASFQLIGSYDFDCALGVSGFSDETFLIGRRFGEIPQGGQLLLATIDSEKGLVMVEKMAEQEATNNP